MGNGHWGVHFKLAMLILLTIYHVYCLKILKAQKARRSTWSQQLRILNEAPTLFLVGIVTAAVFKTAMTNVVISITLVYCSNSRSRHLGL